MDNLYIIGIMLAAMLCGNGKDNKSVYSLYTRSIYSDVVQHNSSLYACV